MRAAHTVEQVRVAEKDRLAVLPPGALMQRAAAGLTVAIADLLGGVYGRRVLLLVGSGDNGGDALYAGAMLARRGAVVEAVLLGAQVHQGGLAALRARHGRVVQAAGATRPDVVVDGIVGIGGRPGLRPEAQAALAMFPDALVVAVDVPSGVDVDTGELDGSHVRADLTVTFGTHKPCHLVDPAAQASGVVTLVDLDLELPDAPVEALQGPDVAALLPVPGPFAHKYTRGVVGVRAGSEQYPGAAVLTTSGASAGLAGMVRYDGAAAAAAQARHPGIVLAPGRVQAWVVGPAGVRTSAKHWPGRWPTAFRSSWTPPRSRTPCPVAPTRCSPRTPASSPRCSRWEREQVEARPLEHARLAAARFGGVVLLKGRHSLVAGPDGRVRVTTSGLPWLAVAGAGDVLAGLIGALLAAGLDPYDAASVGSWVHGAAAVLAGGGGPVTPEAVADAIGQVVTALIA